MDVFKEAETRVQLLQLKGAKAIKKYYSLLLSSILFSLNFLHSAATSPPFYIYFLSSIYWIRKFLLLFYYYYF